MKAAYAKQRQTTWLVIALATVVLAICTVIAANRQVSLFEGQILDVIYRLPGPLTDIMYAVTQTGSAGAVLVIAATTFVLKRKRLAATLLANTLVTYIIVTIIKELVARPRPAEILSGITVRLDQVTGFGFPSGHTATATVLALTLMTSTPKKYQCLLWVWIAAVALSRMYLGVHAPLDIVGGLCIGVIVALSSQLIVKKHGPQR